MAWASFLDSNLAGNEHSEPHKGNKTSVWERCMRSAGIRFFVLALLIIFSLELTLFNLGSWLSPSSAQQQTCTFTSSCSFSAHNLQISSRSGQPRVLVKDVDSSLSIRVRANTPIRTLEFAPVSETKTSEATSSTQNDASAPNTSADTTTAQAPASNFFTRVTIGSQQITLRADRPTFAFLNKETSDAIAREGAVTVRFVEGSSTRVNLASITLNAHKPLRINLLRVCVLLLIAGFLWAMRPRSRVHSIKLNSQSRAQRLAFWACFGVPLIVLGIIVVAIAGVFVGTDQWWDRGNYIYSYHHYILVAQSLLEGHPWLNIPVDPIFDALSNPYNPQLRNTALAQGASIYWDYAFYNHHWYSYFGMLPSALIYIPFHLLTGRWPSIMAVVIPLLMLTVLLLCGIVVRLLERYFPHTTVGTAIIAMTTVFIGTNIISLIVVTNLYIMAFASGLCISSLGVFIWMKVSPDSSARSNMWRMILGSLCIALSTSCRPTFIFIAILVAPVFLELVWKKPLRTVLGATAVNIAAAFAGLAPALWYNWWRFGSITDFGAAYQITVADMRHLHVPALSLLQGVSIYLFRPLEASANPPFVEAPFVSTATWIHHESIIGGFFIFAPLVLLSLFSLMFREVRSRLHKNFVWLYCVLGVVIGLFLCVFVTRSGGIAWRYFVDFSWAFVFASLPAFSAVMDYAASVRDTWRGKLVYSTVSIIALYQILILLASIMVPNRFASFTQYAPAVYSSVVDALTILG